MDFAIQFSCQSKPKTLDSGSRPLRGLVRNDENERHSDHAAALSCAFCSTSRTNSSSSRLVLLRIEVTVMPCSLSAANSEFRSCCLDISASIVLPSRQVSLTPGTSGNGSQG